ncbi:MULTISPECIES: ABC transporter permease [Nocardiaceae]|uniref:ABC transporter permease n=1 Tax=Nocardiaceae TaxID=85025 RepID=UPI001E4986BD|nr:MULTISPECIES: ABC transporter permease [Rhodococcus]
MPEQALAVADREQPRSASTAGATKTRTARRIAARLGQALLILIGTSLIVFVAVFALPGDPVQALIGDAVLTDAVESAIRAKYHLDDPLLVQYWSYVSGIARGDFGTTVGGEDVGTILARAWPVTIKLALTAWVLELIVGVTAGTLAALRPGGLLDKAVLAATVLTLAVPTFVLAFFVQSIVGVSWGILPVAGISEGWPTSYLLPAICLATLGFGPVARLTRSSVLSTRSADFVRTARAKGISTRRLTVRHILRNALVPVVTYLGLDLGGLLGGSVVVEGIFNLPGVGGELFTGISSQQGTVVVGIVSALVLVAVAVNIVVEIAHHLLDPRIRQDK